MRIQFIWGEWILMFCRSVVAVIFHHMFCRLFFTPISINVRNENTGCCWFVILVYNRISAEKSDILVQCSEM